MKSLANLTSAGQRCGFQRPEENKEGKKGVIKKDASKKKASILKQKNLSLKKG